MTLELEDSPDLTDEEAAQALHTDGVDQLHVRMSEASAARGGTQSHEFRRKKPHLYCRTTFTDNSVVLFRVDWLQ